MIKTLAMGMFVIPLVFADRGAGGNAAGPDGKEIQDSPVTGDLGRGRRLFGEKGCDACHSILGRGGKIGLDLAQNSQSRSFNSLLSRFWDHSPELHQSMKKKPELWTEFDTEDMTDLVSYLFYLNNYDRPGVFQKGKGVFESKGCSECHRVGAVGDEDGILLDKFATSGSALGFVTALGNRSSRMGAHFRDIDIKRPTFTGTDLADLHAFVRGSVKNIGQNMDYMSPGKPKDGRSVFLERGCAACHTVRGRGSPTKKAPELGPDLGPDQLRRSVSELAGVLWNHGTLIWDTASGAGKDKAEKKPFNVREMADLVAYLYSVVFYGERGNKDLGRKLFLSRGCQACHEDGDIDPITDPIELATKMWNHIHSKEGEDGERQTWPRFTPEEAGQLAAYLRQPKVDDK